MTALATKIRTSLGTIEKLRDEAKGRVDRFELKARTRLENGRQRFVAERDRVRNELVTRLQKALDLPTHQDISEVSAKVDRLQVRVDELITVAGEADAQQTARPAEAPRAHEAPRQSGSRAKR